MTVTLDWSKGNLNLKQLQRENLKGFNLGAYSLNEGKELSNGYQEKC